MNGSIKGRLQLIRDAADDVRARIDALLDRNDRIDIATVDVGAYEKDLYQLMREMAEVANPVLRRMGLDKEAIESDIQEYVAILDKLDSEEKRYFASLSLDARYTHNRSVLLNIENWLSRLDRSVKKVMEFIDLKAEKSEFDEVWGIIDDSRLTKAEKKALRGKIEEGLDKLKESVAA